MPDIQTKMKFNKNSTTEHVITLTHGYLTTQNQHENPPDWGGDEVQMFWSRLMYLSGCRAGWWGSGRIAGGDLWMKGTDLITFAL